MENPFNAGYYCSEELRTFGFANVGDDVQVAKSCELFGDPANISIGDHVRIDSRCTLVATGPVSIGSYVHIGGGCHLLGRGGLTIGDFANVSQHVAIYTANDDYFGCGLVGPTVPFELRQVHIAPVILRDHVLIGCKSVILPGVTCDTGSATGALTLVSRSLAEWTLYNGQPAKRLMERSRKGLELAERLRGERLSHAA